MPRYADLARPPLHEAALARAAGRTPPWRAVRVLQETGSTNEVAAAAARDGEPEGLVVVAESQTAGRGRLDRAWVSPPRAGLTVSMLFRPNVGPAGLPWLPLLVAAGAAAAAAERAELDVRLKWPNDLLVGGRKVGGLLAEVVGDAVVVGLGLNVSTRREELPRPDATSLELESGTPVDRGPLLLAILRSVGPRYEGWVAGAPVAADYRARCDTIGRPVRVELPGGTVLAGEAEAVDDAGHLVVRDAAGALTTVAAGDVVHVRGWGAPVTE